MRFSMVRWIVLLGCTAVAVAFPAQAYTDGLPPWAVCFADSEANLLTLERSLRPANDATVPEGAPVTFSGNSGQPATFAVASSSALLFSPDIDGGPASAQPRSSGLPTYTFTSAKATVSPGTVYWEASFSDADIPLCAGQPPMIDTTSPRTLTVLPATPTPAPTGPVTLPPVATPDYGETSLASTIVAVQSNGMALVRLECAGAAECTGTLTLTTKGGAKKAKKAKAEAIGTAAFSIPAGKTAAAPLMLAAAGRALLRSGHDKLRASLTILQSSPSPTITQHKSVHLVQKRTTKASARSA